MSFESIRAACIYKQADDLVSREIAGEVLLVPIRNNIGDLESIYTFNETGAFIWSKIDGKKSLADICEDLLAEFEVSKEQAWQDITEFVEGLLSISALVEVN